MQNETLSPDWLEPLETRVCYVCLCRPSGTITSPAKCLTLVNPIRFGYVVGWPPFQSFSRYGAGSQGTLNTSNLPNHLWRQIIIALNGMVPFFRYLNLGPRARVLPPYSTPPSARARTHNIRWYFELFPILRTQYVAYRFCIAKFHESCSTPPAPPQHPSKHSAVPLDSDPVLKLDCRRRHTSGAHPASSSRPVAVLEMTGNVVPKKNQHRDVSWFTSPIIDQSENPT